MKLLSSNDPQQTLAQETVYEGVGLHTGNKCRLVFKPAPLGTGIVFVRSDLEGQPRMPASYKIVSSVVRGTTLSLEGQKDHEARVHTVEHVLSALYGLGIDNLIIEANANEPPVADGSSQPFVEVLLQAGLQAQGETRRYFQPDPLEYKTGDTFYKIEPSDKLILEATIDFNHPMVNKQTCVLDVSPENYQKEVARARTFCFDYEVEALKRQGLAKGGSLDNAVVVGMDGVHNKEKSLRYPDEFVRHKTLDLLGDLYLLGVQLRAKITAERVGHGHTINFLKQLAAQLEHCPAPLSSTSA